MWYLSRILELERCVEVRRWFRQTHPTDLPGSLHIARHQREEAMLDIKLPAGAEDTPDLLPDLLPRADSEIADIEVAEVDEVGRVQ